MKPLISFLALLALAVASSKIDPEPLSDEIIFYINNVAKTTWKAGRNFQPNELARVIGTLGVDIEKNKIYNRYFLKTNQPEVIDVSDLPTSYDPRTKYPNCSTVGEIRDQSACGSCWAFGAVEAMSDRICIKYGKNVHLSAVDVMVCCEHCGPGGCQGGIPAAAWDYYVKEGIVTGGTYHSNAGCKPYPLPNCDHHVEGKYSPCQKHHETPTCKKGCESSYPSTYQKDKHYGVNSYGLPSVSQVMKDLVEKGPVTAAFTVYSDFPNYKSGVYEHKTGGAMGGHAVKIIGYGVEAGVDYWLVANSWNTDWGDKGFFKIKKGTDECDIESGIVAGDVKE